MNEYSALAASVEALLSSPDEPGARQHSPRPRVVPSRGALQSIVSDLRAVLFPGYFGSSALGDAAMHESIARMLQRALAGLQEQIGCALRLACAHGAKDGRCLDCAASATEIARAFAERLRPVRELLHGDAKAAYDGDPAARSLDEVLLCYPGFLAITYHRLAHELERLSVPLIPRLIAALGQAATAIDIHPAARIGGRFFIDHGTGVVIGETTIVGERVRLYQGVTLGAKSFPLDQGGHPIKAIARHPIVEDDVVIYAGATILGRVTIGKGSSIGGNVWLTRSVPPNSRITQAQACNEPFEAGGGI